MWLKKKPHTHTHKKKTCSLSRVTTRNETTKKTTSRNKNLLLAVWFWLNHFISPGYTFVPIKWACEARGDAYRIQLLIFYDSIYKRAKLSDFCNWVSWVTVISGLWQESLGSETPYGSRLTESTRKVRSRCRYKGKLVSGMRSYSPRLSQQRAFFKELISTAISLPEFF